MKALIRKHGFTPTKASQDEVYVQSQWHDWINPDTGAPLTDENLGYALCEDCPENMELTVDMFEVTEHTKEIPSEYPEEPTQKVRYWMAKYIGEGTTSEASAMANTSSENVSPMPSGPTVE